LTDTIIKSVIVVGGGLAGLSAGCALSEAGFKVTLLERRPYVGGRASSYEHPGTGEIVDNCQHVLLGCCTNLIDLYRRTGVESKIRWFDRLTFLEPGGRATKLQPSFWPSPFHSTVSFLSAAMLSLGDKLSVSNALMKFARGIPEDNPAESFAQWLKRNGQSKRAIRHFWEPVLVSALNEDLDRISIRYAAQVFRESFLKSAAAGRMGVPSVPLTELYSAAIGYIEARGGSVKLRTSVDSVRPSANGIEVTAGSETFAADAVVMAVPWGTLTKFVQSCDPEEPEISALAGKLEHLESSPITGIHLWFDRQITDLDHAVLLDRTIQWMFHKSKLHPSRENGAGSYVELVVSASKSLVEKQRQEIIDLAVAELAEFFPELKQAKLLKATVIKEIYATYSVQPGSDRYRPSTYSPWPNVFFAGDWIETGWPATMEGAVRGGYIAAEALANVAGQPRAFVVPDLPARGFMRFLGSGSARKSAPVAFPEKRSEWCLSTKAPASEKVKTVL